MQQDINDISTVIIDLLKDHGYEGLDALEQLNKTYQIIQDTSFKNWLINDIDKFITLKDLIWYNFEYNNTKLGIGDLKTLGSKFPIFINLFNESPICEVYLLPELLKEINVIIELWKKSSIYLPQIYDDLDPEVPIIIYKQGESPNKYSNDIRKRTLNILNEFGNNIVTTAKKYIRVEISGPLNDFEQSKIYFMILTDLYHNVQSAIQYHKHLRLVEKT